MLNCEMCNSDTLVLLGAMGTLDHFRCRDCGWVQSFDNAQFDDLPNESEDDPNEVFEAEDDGFDDAYALSSADFGSYEIGPCNDGEMY